MSRHSFNPDIAKQVGVNAAVIYQNMLWWSERNFVNGKNIQDGYCWTYNSRRAWAELFTYLTEAQIRTAIDKLVDSGLVIKGDYNKNRYDRTSWYAPTISSEWIKNAIGDNDNSHWSKIANGLDENNQPIPVSKPLVKQDTPYSPPRDDVVIPDWIPVDEWNGWLEMRKGKRIKETPRAIRIALNRLTELRSMGQNPADVLDQSTISGWTKLYEVKQNGIQQDANGLGRTAQAALSVFGDDADPFV